MRTSPRGKHLDWQFRHCDSVLWLLHALKPVDGPTMAAMNHMQKYGKKTVIAITQVDKLLGGDLSASRNVRELSEKFGRFACAVAPINGKLAMESSIAGDADGIERSGLNNLVNEIRSACLTDAAKVRSIGQYISLRATESQLRSAMRSTECEIVHLQRQFSEDRLLIVQAFEKVLQDTKSKIEASAAKQLEFMLNNVFRLTLADDDNSAPDIIQATIARNKFADVVEAACLIADLQIDDITTALASRKYSLPGFDAEGKRHGSSMTATTTTKLLPIRIGSLHLRLRLESKIWARFALWCKRKFLGLFSATARREADEEERRMNAERHRDVKRQIEEQWGLFGKTAVNDVEKKNRYGSAGAE